MKITHSEVRQQLAAHLSRLWRYGMVLSRNRDVAEELVQSTCVRALERSAQYQSGTRIDRWLFTILHSVWISDLRAQRVRAGQGFVDGDDLHAPDSQPQDEQRRQYQKVMQRVGQLPEAQRNAVFLVYVEGFTYQEAADTLMVPVGTIMSRLAAARACAAQGTGQPPRADRRLTQLFVYRFRYRLFRPSGERLAPRKRQDPRPRSAIYVVVQHSDAGGCR